MHRKYILLHLFVEFESLTDGNHHKYDISLVGTIRFERQRLPRTRYRREAFPGSHVHYCVSIIGQ